LPFFAMVGDRGQVDGHLVHWKPCLYARTTTLVPLGGCLARSEFVDGRFGHAELSDGKRDHKLTSKAGGWSD